MSLVLGAAVNVIVATGSALDTQRPLPSSENSTTRGNFWAVLPLNAAGSQNPMPQRVFQNIQRGSVAIPLFKIRNRAYFPFEISKIQFHRKNKKNTFFRPNPPLLAHDVQPFTPPKEKVNLNFAGCQPSFRKNGTDASLSISSRPNLKYLRFSPFFKTGIR